MIQFENVTKTYAGGKVKAVDGLNMQIEDGKVFGFIGPNGAGKTTTIKLLTGILSPDSGRVLLNGIDMARDPIAAKRSFGYVPDAFDMYERLTGMDYLNFMADLYGVDAASRKRHIEKYLALFELEDAANQQIRGYSRGMKQKLAITGALIHEPSIWVLDEPWWVWTRRACSCSRRRCAGMPTAAARCFSPPMCWMWPSVCAMRSALSSRAG